MDFSLWTLIQRQRKPLILNPSSVLVLYFASSNKPFEIKFVSKQQSTSFQNKKNELRQEKKGTVCPSEHTKTSQNRNIQFFKSKYIEWTFKKNNVDKEWVEYFSHILCKVCNLREKKVHLKWNGVRLRHPWVEWSLSKATKLDNISLLFLLMPVREWGEIWNGKMFEKFYCWENCGLWNRKIIQKVSTFFACLLLKILTFIIEFLQK